MLCENCWGKLFQKVNEESGVHKTPALKNAHKGEAYFLRGYAYYNLWNFFGTAPIDTVRVSNPEQFTPPGTAGTQLLDQAISDFAAAADLLPATWDDANRGRVTANSANGMLGKALVFRASAANARADYTGAITAFNKISNTVKLTTDFVDNSAWDTENNEESLFEFQATQPGFDNVWLDNDFDNPVGSTSIFWGYSDNNFALFDQSPFYVTAKLAAAFAPGDPLLAAAFDPADRSVKKYVSDDKRSQSGVASVNNYRILRFADVLLLKAEAILQSGGSTAEAIGLLNQVRARARAMSGGAEPADRPTTETNKGTVMNRIMTERFLELAGEGQRWFDLRRWQTQGLISLDGAFFNSNTNSMSFQLPKHLNFPIPTTETDVNPNVPQNTGY